MSHLPMTCSDEEAMAFAFRRYFLEEELAEARQMLENGRAYEEAIAYLSDRGHTTLRASGEPGAPRLFLTIPGGTVFIRHPARPFPQRPIWEGHVSLLATLVLPRPETQPAATETSGQRSGKPYQEFSLFDDVVPSPDSAADAKPRTRSVRSKKLVFVEREVRMGSGKTWWTRDGWVAKECPLGYVIEARTSGAYEVSLVHLKSNHVMASILLLSIDETTHARVRGWVHDALQLTDWSRGIRAILNEQSGEHKKYAWSRKLEDLWKKHRDQHYQFSLFTMENAH